MMDYFYSGEIKVKIQTTGRLITPGYFNGVFSVERPGDPSLLIVSVVKVVVEKFGCASSEVHVQQLNRL